MALAKENMNNGFIEHCMCRKIWMTDVEHATEERGLKY
jgi:hypothetical protein